MVYRVVRMVAMMFSCFQVVARELRMVVKMFLGARVLRIVARMLE